MKKKKFTSDKRKSKTQVSSENDPVKMIQVSNSRHLNLNLILRDYFSNDTHNSPSSNGDLSIEGIL
jgi:hypothetical protein